MTEKFGIIQLDSEIIERKILQGAFAKTADSEGLPDLHGKNVSAWADTLLIIKDLRENHNVGCRSVSYFIEFENKNQKEFARVKHPGYIFDIDHKDVFKILEIVKNTNEGKKLLNKLIETKSIDQSHDD